MFYKKGSIIMEKMPQTDNKDELIEYLIKQLKSLSELRKKKKEQSC